MTALLGLCAVVFAAVVKGAIGFGFPTVATPGLALFFDVKTAVTLLIVPNIVMDALQLRRVGGGLHALREFAVLLAFGAVGTVLGTKFLVLLSAKAADVILGAWLILFVATQSVGRGFLIPKAWHSWLPAPVGLISGLVGGLTNAPAPPVVVYFYALGLEKRAFVRAVSVVFIVYKIVQLGAVTAYGIMTWRLLGASVLLTIFALGAFAGGLRLQDRLDQEAFKRAVLAFLALISVSLLLRGLL